MFALFWTTVLVMLTLYFSGLLDTRRNPNRNLSLVTSAGGPAEVVLQRNHSGHYLANGAINQQMVEFLVDTGATLVSMSASSADRLGLQRGAPTTSLTAGGVVHSWLVTLDSVQIGPIQRRDVRAVVVPGMPGDVVLLGMSFLDGLEMVQRDDTLIIRPPG